MTMSTPAPQEAALPPPRRVAFGPMALQPGSQPHRKAKLIEDNGPLPLTKRPRSAAGWGPRAGIWTRCLAGDAGHRLSACRNELATQYLRLSSERGMLLCGDVFR